MTSQNPVVYRCIVKDPKCKALPRPLLSTLNFAPKIEVFFFVFRDPYVLAIRSVTLPTHPSTEDTNRGEMLCAGFTIDAVSENVSKVSAYNIFKEKVSDFHSIQFQIILLL